MSGKTKKIMDGRGEAEFLDDSVVFRYERRERPVKRRISYDSVMELLVEPENVYLSDGKRYAIEVPGGRKVVFMVDRSVRKDPGDPGNIIGPYLSRRDLDFVEMNFGISGYDLTDPDIIVKIPTQGRLPSVSEINYRLKNGAKRFKLKPEKTERIFPAVEFPVRVAVGEESRLILPWIEEREEWIALLYNEWLESARGRDSHYYGPYEIDYYCGKKIIEAYGLGGDMNPDEMRNIGPDELLEDNEWHDESMLDINGLNPG